MIPAWVNFNLKYSRGICVSKGIRFLRWPPSLRVISFIELVSIKRKARLCRENGKVNFGPVEFVIPMR